MLVANATGCSSIYGGNLPTTPWASNADGRGPAWANSLFEDNAEFGLGMRLALDAPRRTGAASCSRSWRRIVRRSRRRAARRATRPTTPVSPRSASGSRGCTHRCWPHVDRPARRRLLATLADYLVQRSVWIVGGDGWAYDIGFGGLDHVLASGRNVNILVLDTEVYSNTGGQASKATPRGAVAKFAAGGKTTAKKDLGMIAMAYGNVYVAQVAMGANMTQTVKALRRGRGLRRAVADHRLQPLHRPRHRHERHDGPPEDGGPERLLAAVPLRPPT